MSKAGDFPQTELENSEFPKMEVKPLDFLEKELHEVPKTELKAGDFPEVKAKTHNIFLPKKESKEVTASASLVSSESTITSLTKTMVSSESTRTSLRKPLLSSESTITSLRKPTTFLPKKESKGATSSASLVSSESTRTSLRKPTSFLPKKGSKGATSFASLLSSESTVYRNLVRKSLMRRRHLMSLLWSYQMRITNDWVIGSSEDLFDEKPLRYFAGLIPMEIIRGAIKGERSCFNFTNDNDLVQPPKAILNLAIDLAIDQLIQTLISISNECRYQHPHHVKYIRLSARSDVEKRVVTTKIEAALNDKHHTRDNLKSFHGTLSIDASTYPASAENQFRRHICQQLQLPMTKDDDILCTKCVEEEMSINRYLVLLVDRDGGETIDPRKVGFCKTQLAGVLVLITAESTTAQTEDDELIAELMDLEIKIRDHLLSWEVFCHNVGKKNLHASGAILTTAVRIVEGCHGHLLAIVLVAKWLLRNLQDVNHWELALHKIHHTNPSYDIQGHLSTIMKNTFLNLIWDSINKVQKHCLLRCLFIPEIRDGKLDYELLNDWISSLFVDAEEAEQYLRELLDNSVLLQFESNGSIRLPEETYKILQSIYNLNPLFVDISGQGLTEPPDTNKWQNALRIELSDNKLSELPLSPYCMELKVLMLQRNVELTKIPSSFFLHMPLLQIMDLSYTSVRELPRSFFSLEQLRELYLKGCECFMKLPPEIGNLQKLEKLDLDETQITHMPEEVQKLTNMQSLTLYFYEYRGKKNKQYSCSTIIPSGVLSKLKRLKHLSMGVNPDDERWHDNVQVILPEILGLELLQTLSIYIPQPELLKLIPAYILEEVDFRFIVGRHMQRIISSIPPAVDVKFKQSDRSLKFVKGKDVPIEIKRLLRHNKALFLDRHVTIKSLSEFGMENLDELRVCVLAECKEMQTIVEGGDSNGNCDMLSHLLFLSVSHMKNLRSIWEGPTTPRFLFGMLQSLSLQSCPKLMTLFSFKILGNLSLLKELIVKDCPKLSTLINWESLMHNANTFLPKLRKLSLLHLPELTSIWNAFHIGPGLKEVAFYDCPKLCSLSREELASNALMSIKGETKWWNTLKSRPFGADVIFIPIHEEADVMTQLGIYNDDDIDNCPGGPMDKPSRPTEVVARVLNYPALGPKGRISKSKRNSETWEIRSPSVEDSHTWRKYGQKEVLKMKYPRSYYRCARKFDQGCKATKQVQRVDEDPSLFRIIYIGRHTCKNVPHNIPPLNLDSVDESVVTDSNYMGKPTDPNSWNALKGRPSEFDRTFIPIHEEADVITQLGIYNDDDIDNCPGGPMDKPSQPTNVATPVLNLPPDLTVSLKGCTDMKRRTLPRWTNQVRVNPGMGVEGPLDDGYSWRKYGQKDILGTLYPRDYYRCTHRNVKGCLATKQVQRTDEDPTVFEITYRGQHTCTVASSSNAVPAISPKESQDSNLKRRNP